MGVNGPADWRLQKCILEHYDQNDLEMLLHFHLDLELEHLVSRGDFEVVVFEVIKAARKKGWYCRLIRAIAEHHPSADARTEAAAMLAELGAESAQEALEAPVASAAPIAAQTATQAVVPAAPPPAPVAGSPIAAETPGPAATSDALLLGGRCFLDRALLRQHLREMGRDSMVNVLVVNGPTLSGKSYSWHLLEWMYRGQRSHGVVILDLEEYIVPAVLSAGELMEIIALRMEIDPDFKVDGTALPPRRAAHLASWLAGKQESAAREWLVVLDHVDKANLSDDARHLVQKLIRDVARSAIHRMDLVLLGYEWKDPDPRIRVLTETVQPIGVPEVRDFFREINHRTGRGLGSEDIDLAAETTLRDLPDRRVLDRRILDVAETVFGPGWRP